MCPHRRVGLLIINCLSLQYISFVHGTAYLSQFRM